MSIAGYVLGSSIESPGDYLFLIKEDTILALTFMLGVTNTFLNFDVLCAIAGYVLEI